ncbi:MAG TPA: putative lipid II flippase FtsW [Thiobacillaceae bacterium]|nr:putative lipid II flippase FtsW [Thiobacillaceae bacterium]
MFHNAALKRTALSPHDWWLLWTCLALLSLGLVMVYSASVAVAETFNQNHNYYLIRHGMYLTIGLAGGYVMFQLPSDLWQKLAPPLFILGVVLLALVLLPVFGHEAKGGQRWIPLGALGKLQPSEFMKVFAILYAADYTVRKAAHMDDIRKGFLPMFAVMVAVGTLLLMEPDFGAFVVIITVALAVLFLGGLNWRLFVALMGLLIVAFVALIRVAPYRMARVASFWNPWDQPLREDYQLSHSLIAFGRGELTGVGLGSSVEKLHYLPEAHNDFLLAVIGEELGLIGVAAVIGLFAWMVWRAFSIGWQAALMQRNFQALTAQGIAVWLGVQGIINMGVNMGVLPTKGLTLPLMSYGGSALIANCLALALLLRIDYENRRLMRGKAKGIGR